MQGCEHVNDQRCERSQWPFTNDCWFRYPCKIDVAFNSFLIVATNQIAFFRHTVNFYSKNSKTLPKQRFIHLLLFAEFFKLFYKRWPSSVWPMVATFLGCQSVPLNEANKKFELSLNIVFTKVFKNMLRHLWDDNEGGRSVSNFLLMTSALMKIYTTISTWQKRLFSSSWFFTKSVMSLWICVPSAIIIREGPKTYAI